MPTSLSLAALLLGRVLFAGLFLSAGLTHFKQRQGMIAHGRAAGMPFPELAVPGTGLVMILGGLSVLLGAWVPLGTLLLAGFLLASAVAVHRFWGLSDAQAAQQQFVHFTKNLGLAGAALLIGVVGTGPLSLHP